MSTVATVAHLSYCCALISFKTYDDGHLHVIFYRDAL